MRKNVVWLRWLVSAMCFLTGGRFLFVSIRLLIAVGEPTPQSAGIFIQRVGYPTGLIVAFGVFYLAAGMLFAFSPSLRALLFAGPDAVTAFMTCAAPSTAKCRGA